MEVLGYYSCCVPERIDSRTRGTYFRLTRHCRSRRPVLTWRPLLPPVDESRIARLADKWRRELYVDSERVLWPGEQRAFLALRNQLAEIIWESDIVYLGN
jgi:hypothetical protein